MGQLVRAAYLTDSAVALAGELERYGASAQWKGVYYKGDKIGFMVTQTSPTEDGYEIREDGRLQMLLLGASSGARLRTVVRVDKAFALRSFSFSLDPGTGPLEVAGSLNDRRLTLTIQTSAGARTETRDLPEPPVLSLNLSRRLAAGSLSPGRHLEVQVFDPATLRNAPMAVDVEAREVVRAAGRPVPAFRVKTTFSGIVSTSWVTDLGEVVREESPTGLLVLKETRAAATALSVSGQAQIDLLEAGAVVPSPTRRIDDPTAVDRLRLRLAGASFPSAEMQGAGQTTEGEVVQIDSLRTAAPGPADPQAGDFLSAEAFVESDAPDIVAESARAVEGLTDSRARAERLVRHVHALLEKKPTVSLPSAREVLRTKVGDCNEHAVLFVALARAARIPARIAVGLVYLRGAFYYHAWAEVYVASPGGRGLWLSADPTLNQFPADATHLRLGRGGLDRQAAILPALGRLRIEIREVALRPGSTPTLVGRAPADMSPIDIALPRRSDGGTGCWSHGSQAGR